MLRSLRIAQLYLQKIIATETPDIPKKASMPSKVVHSYLKMAGYREEGYLTQEEKDDHMKLKEEIKDIGKVTEKHRTEREKKEEGVKTDKPAIRERAKKLQEPAPQTWRLDVAKVFDQARDGDISILTNPENRHILKERDKSGDTPIHYLADEGKTEILGPKYKEILKIKDDRGYTPLHSLALKGKKEILKPEYENILKMKNEKGKTPVDFLKERGVDIPEWCSPSS